MLEVRNLDVAYGHAKVLHDVSLTTETGQMAFMIGRNGAGKTTFLKSVVGLLKPESGTIVYDGRDISKSLPEKLYAEGIRFDFIYLSAEYPEWVCTEFNDTFYAIEQSTALNNGNPVNISFDSNGMEITVNNNFFENPNNWTQSLAGTGYDVADPGDTCWGDPVLYPGCNMPNPCPPPNNTVGSGTGWLRTTSPVTPGEVMTLTFSIHDEGDHIYDSCVIVDNFHWVTFPVSGPGTVK